MAFVTGVPVRRSTTSISRTKPAVCMSKDEHSNSPAQSVPEPAVSRRALLSAGAGVAVAACVAPLQDVLAADTQPYKDIPKGFSILRPTAWNEFDSSEGQYDVKWQDIIQPLEFVTVLTTPIGKDKKLADIGTAESVGERLASSRNGQLLSAVEYTIDGTPAYMFEIKREAAHQLTVLTVAKSKLYSVNASASEQRWARREKLLRSVVESFKPKL